MKKLFVVTLFLALMLMGCGGGGGGSDDTDASVEKYIGSYHFEKLTASDGQNTYTDDQLGMHVEGDMVVYDDGFSQANLCFTEPDTGQRQCGVDQFWISGNSMSTRGSSCNDTFMLSLNGSTLVMVLQKPSCSGNDHITITYYWTKVSSQTPNSLYSADTDDKNFMLTIIEKSVQAMEAHK